MVFSKKQASVIERRIRELEKEIARSEGEYRTISRAKVPRDRQTAVTAVEPPWRAPAGTGAARAADVAPGRVPDAGRGLPPPRGQEELFAPSAPTADSDGAPTLFDRMDQVAQSGREKFANYFMAGHFHNLRPLRQESRIIRNKAIVMLMVALLALLLLLYYLYRH